MKRRELAGLEFDWFAVDEDEHVAVFSTAGWGEVPPSVLTRDHLQEDSETEAGLIRAMPPTGAWQSEGRGPGTCEEWKHLGARGLFVFDWAHWSGPYERIVIPQVPARLSEVPEALRARFLLVRLPGCFADTSQAAVDGERGQNA